jgi:dTMP kinase
MDSTTAYQGYGRGLPVDEIQAINRFTVNGILPDLTLLLDLDIATGFERIAQRYLELGESADRFEQEDRSFHKRVRDGYLKLAQEDPKRFRIINAARETNAVAASIWDTVTDVFRQSI